MGDGCHPRCHPGEPLASCPWRDPVPPRAPSPCVARGPCGMRDKAASRRYWANWERGALPFVVQGQSGSERAQRGRGDGAGDSWGPAVGCMCAWGEETCLTPKHGPEGERGRRAGTYRKGGSGTEADLLHGAEQQAAGGHAALAPRLGDGFTGASGWAPRSPARSRTATRAGAGSCRSGSQGTPPLRPSVPPSFPPSLPPQRSQHPRIPASELVPRSHTLTGPSWTGKVGRGLGEGSSPTLCPKGDKDAPPKKGESILLLP